MIAMRLPTGLLLGRLSSEVARTTRMRSGSTSSASAAAVAASVSWPWPADVVWMVSVMAPSASTMMRQDSIHVVVVFFGLSSGSNEELAPLGSRQLARPMPARRPLARSFSRSASSASQSTWLTVLATTA